VGAELHALTLAQPHGQPPGLVLELATGCARDRREGLERNPSRVLAPEAGDRAVDEKDLLDVPVFVDHRLAVLVLQDTRAVLVSQQQLVPARQEACRRPLVADGERSARQIEQLTALLVAKRAQPE
jgi:hypothetical protein